MKLEQPLIRIELMGKCGMNCETCGHSSKNCAIARDSDGYCYMWRVEPEGQCFQHTGYKDRNLNSIPDALALFASILANSK